MPANCAEEARRIGIPEGRITVATPRKPFELKGVKVSPPRAIHGNPKSAVYFDANMEDCGYVIELAKEVLEQAPHYLDEDRPAFDDAYGRTVYQYYGLIYPW